MNQSIKHPNKVEVRSRILRERLFTTIRGNDQVDHILAENKAAAAQILLDFKLK